MDAYRCPSLSTFGYLWLPMDAYRCPSLSTYGYLWLPDRIELIDNSLPSNATTDSLPLQRQTFYPLFSQAQSKESS
jgi:hypothetical protein